MGRIVPIAALSANDPPHVGWRYHDGDAAELGVSPEIEAIIRITSGNFVWHHHIKAAEMRDPATRVWLTRWVLTKFGDLEDLLLDDEPDATLYLKAGQHRALDLDEARDAVPVQHEYRKPVKALRKLLGEPDGRRRGKNGRTQNGWELELARVLGKAKATPSA